MKILRQAIGIGLGVSCFSLASMAHAQPNQALFETVTSAATLADADAGQNPAIVRSRLVSVAADRLQGDTDVPQMDGGKLLLNFFPDATYSVQVDRKETRGDADYTLFGYMDDVSLGRCTLVVEAEKMTGNCSSPMGMYQIRYHSDGVHVVQEIDQSKFPPEAEPIEVSPSGSAEVEPAGSDPDPLKDGEVHQDGVATDDDGSIVDMLVVYTPAARIASSNILGEIQLAIDETNQAYINSGISHRVRLVGTSEVSYTESGNFCGSLPSDLDRLRGTGDGYMDNVHGLRDAYGADQVTLILNSGNACGCAYFMSTVSTSFASNAFSVVRRDCATGYFSFGHELGHNMSAHHDCYVNTGTTPYAYNHGYVHLSSVPSQRWRTVMAYNNECAANGYNCTRIQYFSNPAVNYGGFPTGTSGSGCTANNRLTHVNTDLTVSRFRDGYCYLSGVIDRILAYDDSYSVNNYVYLRPSDTASYYQYFKTTDDNMVTSAARAARKKTEVSVRGDQSCFNNAYDFGGNLDYMYINP